ncbi:MAG TPA: prolipoprotein diacylglyceryl transferase [Ignavibacteriaceae bacterium]|nr:prolipoprotein diacylglyceryl transferase [Ignavibacteriaceae bacterium]
MYPELFKIGPFTVYSYGLMLGIAFIIASYILTKEFERKKLDPSFATEITLLAIIFGIIGSKLFHLFENWDAFLKNPMMAFSPGGLTFYGGLILAIIAIFIYVRKKKIPFLVIADAASPSLILAYGIGRIGCHLAGDGDYGIPTNLSWGVDYSHGTVPPSAMFNDFNFQKYFPDVAKHFPNGVPDTTPLHPVPLYEFILAVIIFLILWKLRKKDWADGKLFVFYLIFAGIERFSVETIRLNPRILLGFTEAQIISIIMVIAGTAGLVYFNKHKDLKKFTPPPIKTKLNGHNKKEKK